VVFCADEVAHHGQESPWHLRDEDGAAALVVGGAIGADELGEFLGGAYSDPTEEGEGGVGVAELGAKIRSEDDGGAGLGGGGGGVGQGEEVGEDGVGGA